MGQTVFDYFIRANAANLGANWTNTSSVFTLAGNTAAGSSSVIGAFWANWVSGNDHYAEVILAIKGAVSDAGSLVRCAIGGGAITAYEFEVNDTDGAPLLGSAMSTGLYKIVANAFTQLGSSVTLVVNAGDIIRTEVFGTTVIGKLNGTIIVGPVTDAAIASGKPGITMGGGGGVSTPYAAIKSFAAGDFYLPAIPKQPLGFPSMLGMLAMRRARARRLAYAPQSYVLSGTTLDSNGNIVGSVTVKLYTTVDDIERASTISDSVTGAYSFRVGSGAQFYCVGYLAGSPDRAGTTVNTLTEAGA